MQPKGGNTWSVDEEARKLEKLNRMLGERDTSTTENALRVIGYQHVLIGVRQQWPPGTKTELAANPNVIERTGVTEGEKGEP
jgi:hypothetical protein